MKKYLLILLLSKFGLTQTSVDRLDQCTQSDPNEILMQSYVSTLKCFNERFLELLKNEPTLLTLEAKEHMSSEMFKINYSAEFKTISQHYPELKAEFNKEYDAFLQTNKHYYSKYRDQISELLKEQTRIAIESPAEFRKKIRKLNSVFY